MMNSLENFLLGVSYAGEGYFFITHDNATYRASL
jgi:hypothetical protein